jgi:L-alanine-DL-glutamate epimerase-like enolase superfamily enzyme
VTEDARVASLRVFDASPPAAVAVKWSEVGPSVRPAQVIVAVELERDGERASGVAGATRYLTPAEILLDGATARAALAAHVGRRAVPWAGRGGAPRNPYEPVVPGLDVLVELASLDAAGHLLGLPATTFLGGAVHDDLPAYASLPSFADPDDALACARLALATGFRAVKFHAAGDVATDVVTARRARAELGAGVDLLWDGSCGYDLYGALRVGRALEEAGFSWFEAPLADDAGPVLSELARRLGIPLIPDATASHRSPGDWARDVHAGLWSGLRLDVTRVNGLADAQRVVRTAEAHGRPCEIQSFGHGLAQVANLNLMLTTMACSYFEAPFPVDDLDDGLVPPLRPSGGRVGLPGAIGLGHQLQLATVVERCPLIAELVPERPA